MGFVKDSLSSKSKYTIDEEDKVELEKGKELAKNAVIEILKSGIDSAMNKYN